MITCLVMALALVTGAPGNGVGTNNVSLDTANDVLETQVHGPDLHTLDPKTPEGLRELLAYNGDSLPLVGAHRGGARAGYPENCIATFEQTLEYTYAMMEVDPRYTQDGFIVLHHDPRLERTTNGKGLVADFSLQELKRLRLRDSQGNLTAYSMPTLDEALVWARGKTILVLDQKTVLLEARVKAIEEHDAAAYTLLIVYSFAEARSCYAMNPDIMMEVMIPTRERFAAFEKTGVPWSNVVAFVGHSPPQEPGLLEMIHAKGARCIAGSSRNIDRRFIDGQVTDIAELERDYRRLTEMGVDLIETDLPVELGRLLYP